MLGAMPGATDALHPGLPRGCGAGSESRATNDRAEAAGVPVVAGVFAKQTRATFAVGGA